MKKQELHIAMLCGPDLNIRFFFTLDILLLGAFSASLLIFFPPITVVDTTSITVKALFTMTFPHFSSINFSNNKKK